MSEWGLDSPFTMLMSRGTLFPCTHAWESVQDQLFEAIDQSNVYKAELEQFYALPNPIGIGLIVRRVNIGGRKEEKEDERGGLPGVVGDGEGMVHAKQQTGPRNALST